MLETIEHDGNVRELRMARPPVNALDPQLIRALRVALTSAADQARAVVLSGRPGMFTAGLDVPALLLLDRPSMTEVWRDFLGLMHCLAASPVPVVAAITGHSPAGGAVMAVFCDCRVMAAGDFTIGLNEVAVGLPVPPVVVRAFARLVGEGRAERLLSTAAMLAPEQAREIDLVDEVTPLGETVARAVVLATRLARQPAQAQRMTRRYARQALLLEFDALGDDFPAQMADIWFSEETQGAMRALVAKLAARGNP